ncbi:unnamed protein product [Moneuplotes crassus]|uniref:Golgin subfamily A member 7/ERF4 domain-containing protein n=1 Tax=Euplotes crassus TaxID=5936 RepID=A0AAD2D2P4_EUPCR|nr:unnamed protein product [Moneuplotes crassus]
MENLENHTGTTRQITENHPLRNRNGEVLFRVVPTSCTFINGLAPSYSTRYDEEALGDFIEKRPFKRAIGRINDVLFQFWPCTLCYYGFGLVLGILTCGLSCILPYICIREAMQEIEYEVKCLNEEIFAPKGLLLEYEGCCYRSCFKIQVFQGDEMTLLSRKDLPKESFAKNV